MPGLDRLLCGARGKRAADFHDAAEIILKRGGWAVKREYRVALGGNRDGYIDLVASINTVVGITFLALELDNRSPRKKSALKLEHVPVDWLRGILLRDPQ